MIGKSISVNSYLFTLLEKWWIDVKYSPLQHRKHLQYTQVSKYSLYGVDVGYGLWVGAKSILISCKAGAALIIFILFQWYTLQEKKNVFLLWNWFAGVLPKGSLIIVNISTLIIHFYLLEEIFLCDVQMFIHFLVTATWTKYVTFTHKMQLQELLSLTCVLYTIHTFSIQLEKR